MSNFLNIVLFICGSEIRSRILSSIFFTLLKLCHTYSVSTFGCSPPLQKEVMNNKQPQNTPSQRKLYKLQLQKAPALIPFILVSRGNNLFSLVKTELNHLSNPCYRSTKYLDNIIYYQVLGLACWMSCRKYTNEITAIWETAHSLEACLDDLI